MTKLTTV